MTMLEKAARAAFDITVDGELSWDELSERAHIKQVHRKIARAVLEAIREPDEATFDEGWKGFEPAGIWRAMIEAIIKGGGK